MAYPGQDDFANQYLGGPPQMFNPNETEEQRRQRYIAENLRGTASDEQAASQQRDYDRLAGQVDRPGPKGQQQRLTTFY